MRLIKILSEFAEAESAAELIARENAALAEFPESAALIVHVANSTFRHLSRFRVRLAWIEELIEVFGLPHGSLPPEHIPHGLAP